MGASGSCVGSRGRCGVEVEAPAVEVDGGLEAPATAEAAGLLLDPLNLSVQALGAGVGDAQHDRIDDAPQVVTDRESSSLHRLEPAALRPADPALPLLPGPASSYLLPYASRRILHRPRLRLLPAGISH